MMKTLNLWKTRPWKTVESGKMITIPWSYISKINVVEITILSKVIYRFNVILTNIPTLLFTKKGGKHRKILMEWEKVPGN